MSVEEAVKKYNQRKAQMEKDDVMCEKINDILDSLLAVKLTESNMAQALGSIGAVMEVAGRRVPF